MNKALAILLSVFLICSTSNAQYYYKDLLNTAEIKKTIEQYKANKVRQVNVVHFEPNGTQSNGFYCEKKINKKFNQVSLFSRSDFSPASMFVSDFSDNGLLVHTSDSSMLSVTHTTYEYDAQNRVTNISSTMKSLDDDFVTEENEEHVYKYSEKGIPERMFLIKNKKDTIMILFAANENGLVETEMNTNDGSYYYYYYDTKNRLTDIALSTEARPRPTPQYIFQYNSQGDIAQMTTTEEGNKDFTIWKYQYDNGMVVREKCYGNKGTILVGTLEYEYK